MKEQATTFLKDETEALASRVLPTVTHPVFRGAVDDVRGFFRCLSDSYSQACNAIPNASKKGLENEKLSDIQKTTNLRQYCEIKRTSSILGTKIQGLDHKC